MEELFGQDHLSERLAEFEEFVWIHTDDAFQQKFDTATDISEAVRHGLDSLIQLVERGADEEELAAQIAKAHSDVGPGFLEKVIQLVGLTRNKLVTDVDAIGRAAGLTNPPPRTYGAIPGKPGHWPLAARELSSRFLAVFGPSAGASAELRDGVIETVNRATWPGYIRQERAKRSGHEAEARLARICKAVGLPFEPKEKAEQDIAADVQVGRESFDLVFPDAKRPGACVIATVHTANIGQYGESKDARDITAAKAALAELPSKPLVIALADGLGFRSNRAGLEGVLRTADEFCQFRTIWKAVVVAAAVAKTRSVSLWLPDPDRFAEFLKRYEDAVTLLRDRPEEGGIEAGDGIFLPL